LHASGKQREIVMRQSVNSASLVMVTFVLMLELAMGGLYVMRAGHAAKTDACYGYAICR
jgi:hypothetical protein